MEHHSIILRAANPSFDEGLIFARYADEVAEGFFRFMLGRNVITILATAYLQPNHDHSYQNVTFAERDNGIVGMASGYSGKQRHHFSDQPLKHAAGSHALRMKVVKKLCAPLIHILETVPESDFYLLSLAVNKELRGEGVGSMLMDAVEDRARAGGSTRLSLDVSAKNEGARRLYERRGMTVESQWPKRLVIPGIKLLRMTKTL
ncbi:MAG: GNAT family N-acetyltransferase [bacterium]|nr:GNAT family N-acetyltransferase [bacterium]